MFFSAQHYTYAIQRAQPNIIEVQKRHGMFGCFFKDYYKHYYQYYYQSQYTFFMFGLNSPSSGGSPGPV